ncbi:hypothetical protein DPMN_101382 [Dreissena polymorpha]|uniref:Uncharacterized protein n=1 Tax=Dreissena polymorpha TaxID=45954 RepID=A0A9D4LJC3_DREPO|nr:hypothetical protein DPMN_101382 [Dreissena polymorpha]
MVFISTVLRCPYVKRLLRLLPRHSRAYYDATQSVYCAFTTIMKISPRCFRAACTITALLLRSFYDSTPIFVGHDPVTLVLSMFKISVARA